VIKTYIIVAVVSYLLGSIPFGYILVKLFLKQDIRSTGSGNIGATNVARSGAKGLAIATLILDAAKGALAVLAAAHIWKSQTTAQLITVDWGKPQEATYSFFPGLLDAMALAAFCAVLGHVLPLWLKFKGGKGVATAIGAFMVVAPPAATASLVAFIVIVAATRYVSLGSVVGTAIFPIVAYSGFRHVAWNGLLFSAVTSLVIILKHHENIRRLLAGTENKFGAKKSIPPPDAVEKQA